MFSELENQSLRIIQTNLQVRDTEEINPERLAQQIDNLGGNALVFNVGGIYAWYDTDIRYHTKNPHLPEEIDLLEEVIEKCHEHRIKFIGRVDFSKADDEVFAHHPEWFARDPDGESKSIGAERPGTWSILKSTCLNSAYRKEAVAIPVLRELISQYNLDGIFYNAPHYIPCHCDTCRRKYKDTYGEPLPDNPEEFQESWSEKCLQDNMEKRYNVIKEIDEDIQMILYYNPNGDNLSDRAASTDMLCTESQNVVSRGHLDLPGKWKPARTMKVANTIPDGPPPIGIIHASPGMDWRHVGIPSAEYKAWLSQIPSNNGNIWHTLTGVPDTIVDDRIFDVVKETNKKTEIIESYMSNAESAARTLLLWDETQTSKDWFGSGRNGLVDGLTQQQIPFDLLLSEQVSKERLVRYNLVIVPANWEYNAHFIDVLNQYVNQGGRVLVEGDLPDNSQKLFDLLGISGNTFKGEDLVASYSRFKSDDNPLQNGLNDTELIPHRGKVNYCETAANAQVLLTLVPQWSPLEAVGRPPERASIPVSNTDIPMAISSERALYFPFQLSQLLYKYRMSDHYQLLGNAVSYLLGDHQFIDAGPYQGLQLTPYKVDDGYLLHLINFSGDRPLMTNTSLSSIDINLSLGKETEVNDVSSLFSEQDIMIEQDSESLNLTIPSIDVWEAVLVQCEN